MSHEISWFNKKVRNVQLIAFLIATIIVYIYVKQRPKTKLDNTVDYHRSRTNMDFEMCSDNKKPKLESMENTKLDDFSENTRESLTKQRDESFQSEFCQQSIQDDGIKTDVSCKLMHHKDESYLYEDKTKKPTEDESQTCENQGTDTDTDNNNDSHTFVEKDEPSDVKPIPLETNYHEFLKHQDVRATAGDLQSQSVLYTRDKFQESGSSGMKFDLSGMSFFPLGLNIHSVINDIVPIGFETPRSYEEINERLALLFEQIFSKISDMEPIIEDIYQKFDEFKTKRKYDHLSIVGSTGNKLYFPERLSDGSYQVEIDVLFQRELHGFILPTKAHQRDQDSDLIKLNLEVDDMDGMMPRGKFLLRLKDIEGHLSERDRETYFKAFDNGKTYLKSYPYRSSIPHQSDDTITNEQEIGTFNMAIIQPLFRTFKCKNQEIETCNGKMKYSLLIDKVGSVHIPWPSVASDFLTRVKIWPTLDIMDDVVKVGCNLIYSPTNKDDYYEVEWKTTFSTAEQILTNRFTRFQRALFIVIKLVKRKYLDLGLFKSGEPKSKLTTYHLKTVFLHLSEEVAEEKWRENPGYWFVQYFIKLRECLVTRFCAHYFLPGVNILDKAWGHTLGVTEEELDWIEKNDSLTILTEIIAKIIAEPLQYLTSTLLESTEGKHTHDLQTDMVSPHTLDHRFTDENIKGLNTQT